MTSPYSLSILDQSPIGAGATAAEALASTVDAVRHAERLGYHRYWVAEHHASPGFASVAPEVLAAAMLARTSGIRIGTGGVLLPRYPAEKVAEIFATLANLYPGRVDMGIGRAGASAHRFPEQLADLLRLLEGGSGGAPDRRLAVAPAVPPKLWLLGSGGDSAQIAGLLGSGFAFAHFLAPEAAESSLNAYRQSCLQATGERSRGSVLTVRVVTADTAEKADELAQAVLLWRVRKDVGRDLPIPSVQEARSAAWTAEERRQARLRRPALVVGTPQNVRGTLIALAEEFSADEIMINTVTRGPVERIRMYELLAEAFGLAKGPS
ncbi:MsnO8 family LLM class oxidoreductase [Streptomonospora salina]|uniref:Luciferase family oxidoreductase group 1 n=1 Tax=Streptomonospora salina TaxID=104205 RepID=A0A841E7X0_9ACTN|nr:MsnO8 family LLM class oxidoreductase [Streptomonospora salina]MBB5998574.1 luciferase family oxidoreductase group 1 [Streptomonospora salina]